MRFCSGKLRQQESLSCHGHPDQPADPEGIAVGQRLVWFMFRQYPVEVSGIHFGLDTFKGLASFNPFLVQQPVWPEVSVNRD
jgi:hypothetical protein